MKPYLWTNLKARLQRVNKTNAGNFNWLFLPGGPGLGSESLSNLTKIVKLPGSVWHLDLPGDGSNITPDDELYFSRWSEALMEAVNSLDNVILVGHSTGGMYALATPKLQTKLIGLVLMNSAPDSCFQKEFMEYAERHPIKNTKKLYVQYGKNPNNTILKKITIASAPYSFTKKGLRKGISLFKSLPVNYKTCAWSAKHFDQTYKAKWVPKNIPTLIFSGEKDLIISSRHFDQAKKFKRKNIMIRVIKNAGHFPWIENPKQVVALFKEYSDFLSRQYSKSKR